VLGVLVGIATAAILFVADFLSSRQQPGGSQDKTS
jgi:hypothetical protein